MRDRQSGTERQSDERRYLAQLAGAKRELRDAIDALGRAQFALAHSSPRLAELCLKEYEALALIARWLDAQCCDESAVLAIVKPLDERFAGVDAHAH
jgi:hypothetical protein